MMGYCQLVPDGPCLGFWCWFFCGTDQTSWRNFIFLGWLSLVELSNVMTFVKLFLHRENCVVFSNIYLGTFFYLGELKVGFQDVGFLSSWATFYTTFPENSIGLLRPEYCHMSWNPVGVKQGHAPCIVISLQSNFMWIIRLSQRCLKFCQPHFLGILQDLRQLCISVILPAIVVTLNCFLCWMFLLLIF